MLLLIAVSSVSHSLLPQIRALPLPHVAPLLGALALWEPRGPPAWPSPPCTLHGGTALLIHRPWLPAASTSHLLTFLTHDQAVWPPALAPTCRALRLSSALHLPASFLGSGSGSTSLCPAHHHASSPQPTPTQNQLPAPRE